MSSIALRYAGSEEAVELINTGFYKVLENLKNYDDTYSLATWIRTILVRTAIDKQRATSREMTYSTLENVKEAVSGNKADAKLERDDLLALLDLLPEICKQVFNLYVIDGFTHKEIGSILGISDGTSKWHLSEARKRLQFMLEARGITEKKRKVISNER